MCLSKNIRYLRRKFNLSQEDVAAKLGYKSYTTIQKWESGVSEPPMAKARALATMFGVDITDLTGKDLEKEELVPKTGQPTGYYFDKETAKLAQELKDNPELRVLMDASRDITPDEVRAIINLIKTMKGNSSD